jgi:hypothetical protein
MASIFKIMKEYTLATKVYKSLDNWKIEDIKNDNNNLYNNRIFTIFYLNSKYFTKRKEDLNFIKKRLPYLYSTHSKALAFKAISAYLGSSVTKDMSLDITVNNKKKRVKKSLSFTEILKSNTIKIEPISGVTNYNIEVYKHLPYPIKNNLDKTKELSIKEEFFNEDDNLLDLSNIKQSSEIYCKISIFSNQNLNNLVLNSRLPACFEIRNRKIDFKNIEHKDIRDDRALLFFNLEKNKIKSFKIPLISTTLGECKLPAVTIESMEDSRINDYAKVINSVVIKKDIDISTSKISPKEKAVDLVKKIYKLEESNASPKDFLPYFNFPIKQFFLTKDMSRESFLKNREKNNREWRDKSYNIKRVEIKFEDKNRGYYEIEIEFEYSLFNGSKRLKGVSHHLVSIVFKNGKAFVESIRLAR